MSTEALIFEMGAPGRRAATLFEMDVPVRPLADLLPADMVRQDPAPLPEVSEIEV
ncbi:MAG: aminomethyl-transferring glycine dehydrogenase subunit GcvPB, partial [Ktedonobacterales bacterium]|nr:aminomethyl-transferring glycine dehydrogenase subunit GcvPB [Ktedonobacterales bacterium]